MARPPSVGREDGRGRVGTTRIKIVGNHYGETTSEPTVEPTPEPAPRAYTVTVEIEVQATSEQEAIRQVQEAPRWVQHHGFDSTGEMNMQTGGSRSGRWEKVGGRKAFEIPPPPPSGPPDPKWSPPKKRKVWPWVLAVIAALAIIGNLVGDEDSTTTNTPASEPVEIEITADMLVDTMSDAQIANFCANYEPLAAVDAEELAYEAFTTGYTESDPAPRDVFNEMVSRC